MRAGQRHRTVRSQTRCGESRITPFAILLRLSGRTDKRLFGSGTDSGRAADLPVEPTISPCRPNSRVPAFEASNLCLNRRVRGRTTGATGGRRLPHSRRRRGRAATERSVGELGGSGVREGCVDHPGPTSTSSGGRERGSLPTVSASDRGNGRVTVAGNSRFPRSSMVSSAGCDRYCRNSGTIFGRKVTRPQMGATAGRSWKTRPLSSVEHPQEQYQRSCDAEHGYQDTEGCPEPAYLGEIPHGCGADSARGD